MKPYWAKESTYKFFDEFLTSCIVHDDTLLLKESKHIMDTTMIGECLKTIDIVKKSTPTKYFENFINQKENDKIILGHAVWFWSFVDHDTHNKIEGLISENDLNETYLQQTGIGGCGQFYKSHKGDEIIGILNNWVGFKNLIKETNCKDLDEVKQIIINNINSENIKTTIPMKNILLHLCNPEYYEPIASLTHKRNIVYSFSAFVTDNNKDIDNQLFQIRKELKQYVPNHPQETNKEFTFYDDEIHDV